MSRSPTGHGFWMPASIAGDTGPVCWRRLYVVSERRVFVCPADGNLDSMRSIARPARHLDGVYALR
jgi:hypothetical protein